MDNLTVSSSPHITSPVSSTRKIMLDVIIALCPLVIAAVLFFGYHVLINVLSCVAFCVLFETLYHMTAKKSFNKKGILSSPASDLSCVVTAIILALNLPATISVWGLNIVSGGQVIFSFDTVIVCALGSLFAIVLVKQLFGGIGKNFANPALAARAFLFLTFSSAFVVSQTIGLGFEASTGATWLSGNGETTGDVLLRLLIGNVGSGAVGETCVIAILIGYIYLSVRKVIDFRIPLMIIGWSALFALLFDGLIAKGLGGVDLIFNMLAHVLSGGLLFGSVFMATDYATTPNTFKGNCIFCFGVALFTMLIRVFASFPEGVSFAILIMNCVTPLIDKYVYPKPFGYVKPKKEVAKK